ncbi:pilus assembly protein [Bacillus sp. NTK071]|uniref:TadE/TadG family type IV pilus assembly protein n=1 Tax=Bacillus sp. NTK071 TaxID=2802175 RepID=UPI001A8F0A90|nr:TadE/TadG family type IV pilus assembly protein [Bacillus sp. NTK071]MBN8210563.1 pilus assembly protein [Bacillus sp. NTK071]
MKSEKGQSMVEFALVLPVLVMLLFGIVDFGRIFHAYITIDHASREAARVASIGESDSKIVSTAVTSGSSIHLSSGQVSVSPGGTKTAGSDVRVTITYPITFLTPVISSISGPITLSSSAAMRVE